MLIQLELGSWRLMSLRLSQWKRSNKYKVRLPKQQLTVADPGEGPGGPSRLFLDENRARRAEKFFFGGQGPLDNALDKVSPLGKSRWSFKEHKVPL